MGLSPSKAHPRVTKVAPLQNKEEETPSTAPVDFAFHQNLDGKSAYSWARQQDQNPALDGQLPPLRETWYGRHSAVPRALHFDIPPEQTETSIIKRHPPRRLQKLEPIDLPQVITSKRILNQQEARTTHKAKQELEKKMQIPMYTSGKRQYLHKMQMLEMNRKRQETQAELEKSLHREARIHKERLREHKTKKTLHNIPRNEDGDFLTLPDETFNRSAGNPRDAEFLEHQAGTDDCPRKISKTKTQPLKHGAQAQLLWDGSSSDSEELGTVRKKPQGLVRTRTERIAVFDEFFDRE